MFRIYKAMIGSPVPELGTCIGSWQQCKPFGTVKEKKTSASWTEKDIIVIISNYTLS